MSSASHPKSALDRVLRDPSMLKPGRIGLLTHSAAVTAELSRGVDALLSAGVEVHYLISPEHGYWGTGQAGDGHGDGHDHVTGLPVLDAYGKDADGLESLLGGQEIDQVIIDLQDIGCRFYTYMWSMTDMMTACARLGLPVTVLDRPSPLSSTALGPGLDPGCASFVGRYGIPLRHGARLGEIARTIAERHLEGMLELHVIDAPGADGTAPWVAPSPNMPALTTVALYPGTGLLEGTTLCEGRGTTRPFELFGAPWCGPEVAGALRELDLTGVKVREARFRPTHGTFSGRTLHGAQIHLEAPAGGAAGAPALPEGFDPLRIGHAIIATVASLHPAQPLWRDPAPGRPHFIDLLWGSPALREGIEAGAGYEEILAASPAPIEMRR